MQAVTPPYSYSHSLPCCQDELSLDNFAYQDDASLGRGSYC